MIPCSDFWCRVLARALFIATSLTATPLAACPALTVDELAAMLPGVTRFEFGPAMLPPFLKVWADQSTQKLPVEPDGVALFAPHHRPLLIAFRRAGCLLALLPTPPSALWQALRQQIGPIA
jgi:hypothetical protein